jgi:hypothetical protein
LKYISTSDEEDNDSSESSESSENESDDEGNKKKPTATQPVDETKKP